MRITLDQNISRQKNILTEMESLTFMCSSEGNYKRNLIYRKLLHKTYKKHKRLNQVISKQIVESIRENIKWFKL